MRAFPWPGASEIRIQELDVGYLAGPAEGGPGVVLIHDVWGLSDHFRDLARRLASSGFTALALRLYRHLEPVQIAEPGAWMRALSDPEMLAVVQGGVDYLRGLPECAQRRIGIVGFCMGGMYALLSGVHVRGLSAVVPFYGILSHQHGLLHDAGGLDRAKKPEEPLQAARHLKCPVLAFFGAEDVYISQSDIAALKANVATLATVRVQVYEGAGHAFVNDTRPGLYRPEQARDAWQQMLDFLRRELAAAA